MFKAALSEREKSRRRINLLDRALAAAVPVAKILEAVEAGAIAGEYETRRALDGFWRAMRDAHVAEE